jgi:D-arabinose 1-dehydrogenase-like Zn-dependent alcohol dehydrogenase
VPPADLNRVFFLQLSVVGSTMGTRDQFGRLLQFCVQTGMRPRIDRVLPIREAADGFAALLSGDVFGKIVLTV